MTERRQLQVFECSTALGCATVHALLEKAAPADRRVLVVSVNSRHPEAEDWFRGNPKLMEVASRSFDEVIVLNDRIFPTHPSRWRAGLDGEGAEQTRIDWLETSRVDELFVESLHVPPSLTLAELCSRADVHVYSDGLMVYGPTRNDLPASVLDRLRTVFTIDYLPGIQPLLLEEAGPRYDRMSPNLLRPFFDQIREPRTTGLRPGTVLFLGQALNLHRLMSLEQEISLYTEALVTLARCPQIDEVAFKPHITVQVSSTRAVAARFERATGRPLQVVAPLSPLEAVLGSGDVSAVVGIYSTALFTARHLFGLPAFNYRPKDVLYDLAPFANSNRIPLIAADMLLPSLYELTDALRASPESSVAEVHAALRDEGDSALRRFREAQVAVGFHMQPHRLEHRSAEVRAILESNDIECLDLYLRGAPDRLKTRADRGKESWRRRALDGLVIRTLEPLLPPKKAAKLARSPDLFFRDSEYKAMQLFGKLYMRLTK